VGPSRKIWSRGPSAGSKPRSASVGFAKRHGVREFGDCSDFSGGSSWEDSPEAVGPRFSNDVRPLASINDEYAGKLSLAFPLTMVQVNCTVIVGKTADIVDRGIENWHLLKDAASRAFHTFRQTLIAKSSREEPR